MYEKVFISHAQLDETHGEELEEVLRDGGYRAWRFQRDMQGGKSWRQQLPDNIEERSIFLFIATAHAQLSETCEKELQHSAVMRKPLVTVTIQAGFMPPPPLDDHQTVYYDGSSKAAARLMLALRNAEPLRSEIIPEDWKTWDGITKSELAISENKERGIPSPAIRKDLTVVEKRDLLNNAIAESHRCFESALGQMARTDSRIESRIGHNSSSGFTCFISLDGQPIKGCRVSISADFNGITYDGNSHYAVQWEIDEIRRQMKDINRQIEENLQAVVDGDADVAELVRNLDRQHAALRNQLQDTETMLNQLGHSSGIQERDNRYRIQATVAKLDGEPVFEFLPAPNMTFETPDSRICTVAEVAERLSRVFIGDLSH